MKVEVSNGELVDKITILSIKISEIKDPEQIKNIEKEYKYLCSVLPEIGIDAHSPLYRRLLTVNRNLWKVEDSLRLKEKKAEFDEDFIRMARNVYILNDERSIIKKQINIETGSDFIEEKSYEKY